MATKKTTAEAAPTKGTTPRKRGPAPKGYLLLACRVTPVQATALRAEAWKRAKERGRSIADASEVVREALDAWMKARG
jgi:hypothetical protein